MRDITKLHPTLRKKLEKLQKKCRKKELYIGIAETFRTVDEQNALYAQGRTKPGNIVTSVRGTDYGSHHQWGTAFDFYRADGKGAYDDSDGFFTKVGKIGQSIGLEWGGSWKSPVDKPHFQMKKWGTSTKKLKEKYGTPDNFRKTWKKV